MSGHHKFLKLTEGFSPQRQADIRERTASLQEEMALAQLRQALQLTQSELADQLHASAACCLEHGATHGYVDLPLAASDRLHGRSTGNRGAFF